MSTQILTTDVVYGLTPILIERDDAFVSNCFGKALQGAFCETGKGAAIRCLAACGLLSIALNLGLALLDEGPGGQT